MAEDPFRVREDRAGRRFLVLPHPSGRCHAWNDPEAAGRARAGLAKLTRS